MVGRAEHLLLPPITRTAHEGVEAPVGHAGLELVLVDPATEEGRDHGVHLSVEPVGVKWMATRADDRSLSRRWRTAASGMSDIPSTWRMRFSASGFLDNACVLT